MKWGFRKPSLRKRFAARTSWKRYVRHSLGLKAPRGWGWLTNPRRAAYNRIYRRTTFGLEDLFKSPRRSRTSRKKQQSSVGCIGCLGMAALAIFCTGLCSGIATPTKHASAPTVQPPVETVSAPSVAQGPAPAVEQSGSPVLQPPGIAPAIVAVGPTEVIEPTAGANEIQSPQSLSLQPELAAFEDAFVDAALPNVIDGKVVGVTDGDTITVLVAKTPMKIRLEGIDAPESHQDYGSKARRALFSKIYGKQVRVECKGKDRYGRILGEVILAGKSINTELVKEGWAWHYKQYSTSQELADGETKARKEKAGLWQDDAPEPPWEFRRKPAQVTQLRQRPPPGDREARQAPALPQAAEITVYVTDAGSKYHTAGCRHLAKSKHPIPLNRAKASYGPCKYCHPPQ